MGDNSQNLSRGGQFLLNKYLEWQHQRGHTGSQAEFAREQLGISKVFFSQIMSGIRKPSAETQMRWAEMWGAEVYAAWDSRISDPDLHRVIMAWEKLPAETKEKIKGLVG